MDVENIFRDVKLSKTEMTVLRFIQNDPEQCIRQGVRAVAEQCYSNPSSLVRLAKKLKFSGWLELVYFIKFNITMPKLDVTNDIDYMSVQPEEALTPLLASLKQQRILIHGSGFSQLIAQYIYNKFLVTGVNASLALWPDYEILEQKNAACFDSIWIISKSGRSSSALNWVKALEGKETVAKDVNDRAAAVEVIRKAMEHYAECFLGGPKAKEELKKSPAWSGGEEEPM